MEMQLTRTILEIDISLYALRALEESVHSFGDLVVRVCSKLSITTTADLLCGLLPTLGENKERSRHIESGMFLLEELRIYHSNIKLLISDRMQVLLALNAEMEDLRARLAAVLLLGQLIPHRDGM